MKFFIFLSLFLFLFYVRRMVFNKCMGCGKKIDKRSCRCKSCSNRQRVLSEKTKRKISKANKGNIPYFKGKTKENCKKLKKISEIMKKGGGLKARKGNRFKPTKSEKFLINLIKENNLPFNFVGDGKIWFEGKNHSFNPDFLSKNPKYIIELNNSWHNYSKTKKIEKERLETFSRYGYKTLIIWDWELRHSSQVVNKIKEFIR